MAVKKITLIKDWEHPSGTTFKKGECVNCTSDLVEELAKGGYIATSLKKLQSFLIILLTILTEFFINFYIFRIKLNLDKIIHF